MSEIAGRLEELDESPEYREGQPAFSKEVKETSGVMIWLESQGVQIKRGLRRREDSAQAVKAGLETTVAPSSRKSAPKTGYSAALLEELTQERTAALQATFAVGDPHVALAAVVHALVMAERHPSYQPRSCVQLKMERAKLAKAAEGEAGGVLAETWDGMKIPRKSSEVWGWLLEQTDTKLIRLLALSVAPSINAIRTSYDDPNNARLLHADILARELSLDTRKWFRPTVQNSLGRVPKTLLYDALQDVGKPATEETRQLKKGALALFVEEKVHDTDWLPEPMRTRVEDTELIEKMFDDKRDNVPTFDRAGKQADSDDGEDGDIEEADELDEEGEGDDD